jgi:hypothetical protein
MNRFNKSKKCRDRPIESFQCERNLNLLINKIYKNFFDNVNTERVDFVVVKNGKFDDYDYNILFTFRVDIDEGFAIITLNLHCDSVTNLVICGHSWIVGVDNYQNDIPLWIIENHRDLITFYIDKIDRDIEAGLTDFSNGTFISTYGNWKDMRKNESLFPENINCSTGIPAHGGRSNWRSEKILSSLKKEPKIKTVGRSVRSYKSKPISNPKSKQNKSTKTATQTSQNIFDKLLMGESDEEVESEEESEEDEE